MNTPAHRTGGSLTILLAVLVALTGELIRFSGPQLDFLLGSQGVPVAALTALATYAAPALFTALFLARRRPGGTSVVVAVSVVVAARIAMQFLSGPALLLVGLGTVAAAVSAVTIVAAAASRFGGTITARGVGAGVFLGAGISLVQHTFDSIWQRSLVGAFPALLLCAAAVVLAVLLRTLPARGYSRGVWATGPVIAMATSVFANPAFLASQGSVPLWATAIALVGSLALATVLLLTKKQPVLLLAIIAVGATATIYFVPSWPEPQNTLVSIIVLAFAALLGASLIGLLAFITERSEPRTSSARLSFASAGAGLLIILPTLLYQLDYDMPLGFPNEFIMVGLALVVALHALYVVRWERRLGRPASELGAQATSPFARSVLMGSFATICTLTMVGAFVVRPVTSGPQTAIACSAQKILNWNVHYGVSLAGELTWDDMFEVMQASEANVITLQEVSRGWIMGGGGDQLTYLANKLGMNFAFVGAADLQFGNAILWDPCVPMTDISRTTLEYGDGPQNRSAISATTVFNGEQGTIATAHLQHRESNTPTRMIQLSDMFEGLNIAPKAVVTGDLNAEPGWPEIHFFDSEGFLSAVDTTGDPNALTFPATQPEVRIDWTFGRGLTFGETTVIDTPASDHLPILTQIKAP